MTMAGHRITVAVLFSVGIFFRWCNSDVKCRNDSGVEVDWYILYKLPRKNDGGLAYLYMDESTNGFKLSNKRINSTSGTLANTLKPLLDFYSRKTGGFGYMLYNDQPPPKDNRSLPTSFGHSKGVVMLDNQTGVWLSHSTPRFPAYRNEDFWPNSGKRNAQTFMCVTFPYAEFTKIGLQLMYIHVYPYDFDIPTTFPNELQCVANRNCYPREPPWSNELMLTSMRGKHFSSFAKYKHFKDDLYSGLVVKYLGKDLYVKSWGNMRGPLPSNSSANISVHVYNVKEVQPPYSQSFNDTVDHSKWCVTPDGAFTCIADMNREVSQMSRGGGAICMNDISVGQTFYAMIKRFE